MVLGGLRERITGAATNASERVHRNLQTAQEKLKSGDYTELHRTLADYVTDRANVNAEALREAGFGFREQAGEAWEKRKKDAEKKLFEMAEPMRLKVLLALRESVKSGIVADPDMCLCVKNRLKDLVDLFWVDLTISIEKTMEDTKQATLGQAETDVDALAEMGSANAPCLLGPRWWRAKILYHLLPFDLSIFGNLKDPIWYVLMVFMCFPCFSFLPGVSKNIPIRVPFFILYLILVVTGCPADEFQLVQFIMAIKGLQFVCSGIFMMCAAASMYYLCVHPGGMHTCDVSGPGAKQGIVVSMVDWLGTCMLVWIAFLWLPCSERCAGTREVAMRNDVETNAPEEAVEQKSCCGSTKYDRGKGGRLRGWLCYDFGCFIFSVVFCYFLMCVDQGHLRPGGEKNTGFPPPNKVVDDVVEQADKWTGHVAVYWARIIYALLSFPFLFFWIPGLQGILTHTRITGYNKYGVCVPYTLHPVPKEEDGEKSG